MKTIDLDKLAGVFGGVQDSGDGRGCVPQVPRPGQPTGPFSGGEIGGQHGDGTFPDKRGIQ